MKLASLLQAIGLPPQTIGAGAHKLARRGSIKVRMLSQSELRSCYSILRKVRKEFEKLGKSVETTLIDHLQTRERSEHVSGLSFMETVQERLGRAFVDEADLRGNLESIQLYLAKQDPT